jgi:hypothetical protein
MTCLRKVYFFFAAANYHGLTRMGAKKQKNHQGEGGFDNYLIYLYIHLL